MDTNQTKVVTLASDEEVAQLRNYAEDPCCMELGEGQTRLYKHLLVKLLARLERVEEELETMRLGYRGFP